MSLKEAQHFVGQFIKGEYTPGDYAAFLEWLNGATVEELAIIADIHESMHEKWVLPGGPSAGWVMQLERKLDACREERVDETVMDDREEVEIRTWREEESDEQEEAKAPVIWMRPRRRIRWNAWMTAAAVVVLLTTSTYIYVRQMGSKSGGDLSDRTKLLSMTLVNPRGGAQKELVLEDGSKVWLNAGSVLKYPLHFTGSERLVELSGEAFFEVIGNSGSPFRVLIRDAEVEVLGTFFDVMAYDDEPGSKTTLVEGKVKVISGGQSKLLKPGDQAEITYASRLDSSPGVGPEIAIHSDINPKFIRAWRGGIYRFEGTELHTIMRELERAYNVTVQYQPNVGNPQINGSFDLNKNLDAALKQLEGATISYKLHFNHKGNLVIASAF
jgi:ferric-dicitrate binding protein FerR (iron transport regulator)